jgi:hypothetical protein
VESVGTLAGAAAHSAFGALIGLTTRNNRSAGPSS